MIPRPESPTKSEPTVLYLTSDQIEWLDAALSDAAADQTVTAEERETAQEIRWQVLGNRYAALPENDGSGLAEHDDRVTCPECAGRGRRRWQHAMDVDCTLCGGTGRVNAVIVDQMARMSKS